MAQQASESNLGSILRNPVMERKKQFRVVF